VVWEGELAEAVARDSVSGARPADRRSGRAGPQDGLHAHPSLIGDEQLVVVEFHGASTDAKPQA